MKTFWKKANRGLLLGALLLVVLLTVIVVTEVSFRAQVPEIRATVQAYLKDLTALNLSPEGVSLGTSLTQAQSNAKKNELEQLLLTYWDGESAPAGEFYMDLDDVRTAFEETLSRPAHAVFQKAEISVPENAVSVKSAGPGYAEVTVSLRSLSATFTGDGDAFFWGSEYYAPTLTRDELLQSYGDGAYQGTYSMDLILEMHRVDGEWRITGCYGSVWLENKIPVGGEE